ncbi:hypothetical protein JHK87_052709 [Glycine soja]|nr:hypothetical protein JHK87_052709 [Glycine soja]
MTKAEVKEMILTMDNFVEKQRAENDEFRCTMQHVVATQFGVLGESLILSLHSLKTINTNTSYDDESDDESSDEDDQLDFISRKIRNMWKKRSGSD